MNLAKQIPWLSLLFVWFAAPFAVTAQPLDILLTNDDGWDSIGIQTMKEALEFAGHDVTLVAPLDNRSGSAAGLTLDLVAVQQMSANEYAVDGTPATCVFLGISGILAERPDLIVSGTNNGPNLGPAIPFSGTVGATVAALRAGLPAIAFSTEPPVDDENDPAFAAHFENVAEFAGRLIARFQLLNPDPGVLPERTALSVNYPPLAPEEVAGVVVRVQGRAAPFMLGYEEIAPGLFIPAAVAPPPNEQEVPAADTPAFNQGWITVVPIDANYTSATIPWLTVLFILLGMQP